MEDPSELNCNGFEDDEGRYFHEIWTALKSGSLNGMNVAKPIVRPSILRLLFSLIL